jgi:hypothetical protein
MKQIANKIVIFVMLLMLTGCARECNKMKSNGGVLGDWIVVTYSGNHITDVWKLTNAMVQSEEHTTNRRFVDLNGNVVHIGGGNTKAIRVNDKDDAKWNNYVEFHSEFTKQTYQQFADSLNKK